MTPLNISPILPIAVNGPTQAGNPTAAAGRMAGAADGAGGTGAADGARGASFGDSLTAALDDLSAAHRTADDLALQAATGDLQAVHDFTIASTEAQLLTQLTVNVRNRAVEAFNDIMRMQV